MTSYITAALFLLGLLSAGHALLNKRRPRAALGWIVCCLSIPGLGPLLYWSFGVNRVRTRARKLYRQRGMRTTAELRGRLPIPAGQTRDEVEIELTELVRTADIVTEAPLVPGNRVSPLFCGEEAYPAMLAAIDGAREFVHLASYIFKADHTGHRFMDALCAAHERGVEVRVLVDGIGNLYSIPSVVSRLVKRGVRAERFLPPSLWLPNLHMNLRNHRKILVVDGERAFTGGINISDDHMAGQTDNSNRVIDIHFELEGPIVGHIDAAFLDDWAFTTGEHETPRGLTDERGDAVCRTILDGPNEDIERLQLILVGAVTAARQRVRIMTPYFIPGPELVTALTSASLRGVKIEVLLPLKSDLPFVAWASRAFYWEVLQRDVEIYHQPPPFVHSKLLLVDDVYCQIGSANLDPRSLRLNFELNVEIYDTNLVAHMAKHFDECREASRRVTLEEVDASPLPLRFRDALAKLFSPYL